MLKDPDSDAAPTAGRLLVIDDPESSNATYHELIDGLSAEPPRGFGEVLFTSQAQEPLLATRARGGVQTSDLVLAVLDKPNMRTGFEVGRALGYGYPVALGACTEGPDNWLRDKPFLGVSRTDDRESLDSLVRSEHRWVRTDRPRDLTEDGETIYSCPYDPVGDSCHQRIRTRRPEWTSLPRWDLEELTELFSDTFRFVWVVTPGSASHDDGEVNAHGAIAAGFAEATGREVVTLRHRDARAIEGLGSQSQFTRMAEFGRALDELDTQRTVETSAASAREHTAAEPDFDRRVRVHEIAAWSGLESRELLERLPGLGIRATSASSTLEGADARRLADYLTEGVVTPIARGDASILRVALSGAPRNDSRDYAFALAEHGIEVLKPWNALFSSRNAVVRYIEHADLMVLMLSTRSPEPPQQVELEVARETAERRGLDPFVIPVTLPGTRVVPNPVAGIRPFRLRGEPADFEKLADALHDAYRRQRDADESSRPPVEPTTRPTAEPSTVVVATGVSPKVADVVFTSVDRLGRAGALTAFVLRELALPMNVLPDEEMGLRPVIVRARDRSVVFIRAAVSESGEQFAAQLDEAVRELGPAFEGRVWIPLLGQGAHPRIPLQAALHATLNACVFRSDRRARALIVSLWDELLQDEIRELQDDAEKLLGRPILRHFDPDRQRLTPDPSGRTDVLQLAFRLALARALEPKALLDPDLSTLVAAMRQRRIDDDETVDVAAIRTALDEEYGHVEPNPLWVAWMQRTRTDELETLRNELNGDAVS